MDERRYLAQFEEETDNQSRGAEEYTTVEPQNLVLENILGAQERNQPRGGQVSTESSQPSSVLSAISPNVKRAAEDGIDDDGYPRNVRWITKEAGPMERPDCGNMNRQNGREGILRT